MTIFEKLGRSMMRVRDDAEEAIEDLKLSDYQSRRIETKLKRIVTDAEAVMKRLEGAEERYRRGK